MRADLYYALRQLRRTPVMTAVACLSVAVAVMVGVCAFSLLNAVLFKPLLVPDAHQVHHVFTSDARGREHRYGSSSYRDYVDIEAAGVFDGLAASGWWRVAVTAQDQVARTEYVSFVSPNYLTVLRVPLLFGGGFSERGMNPEIVITEAYWTRTLERDADVLGKSLRLNGQVFTIAGVVRTDFRGTGFGPPLMGWTPATFMPGLTGSTDILTDRRMRRFHVVGRLAGGQTLSQVSARLASLASVLAEESPQAWLDMNGETRALTVLNHRDSLAPPGAREELVLAVAVTSALVLLIILLACTNVAGLLLGRAVERQHEVAVRLTLGATRRRLGAQLLTESLLIGLAGGALGLLAVQWATDFASTFPLLDGFDLRPDRRVLLVALALSLLCPLLFGLAPMLQSIRLDVQAGLRGRANTVQRNRLRGVLIAVQVTVSCVLIQLALHAARGVRNHMNADPGFALDNLLVVQLELRALARDSAQENAYIEQVRELAAAIPGVRNVATTFLLPFGNVTTFARANRPDGEPLPIESNDVSENFFETVALEPIEGRVTDARDRASSRKVAVVSREFVRAWGAPVVGRTIDFERSGSYEIIGVVDNVQYHQNQESHRPLVYFVAAESRPLTPRALLMSIQPGAERDIAAALLPSLRDRFPVVVAPSVETMRSYLARQTQPQQISARAALGIGAAELVMAAIGLYGLLLFAVSARTREMGVRLALGATASRASWAVLKSGLIYAAAGAILGLMLGVPSALLLGEAFLGERAEDLVPGIAAIAIVVAATAAAALVPALRARRVEPAVALRYE